MNDTAAGPGTGHFASARRRGSPRLPGSLWTLAIVAGALLVAASLAVFAVEHVGTVAPLQVTIDGERVVNGWQLGSMPPAHRVVLAAVLLVTLLVALVVVPLALILAVAAVLAVALVVVGLPLLVAAGVLALALSPLLLLGWLAWKLVA